MVFPAALPNVSLSDGIAPCSQMALTQISDLCPHSPLGIEITMTRHPPVQEEPRALPAVATLHTVGTTAVSKVGTGVLILPCFLLRAQRLGNQVRKSVPIPRASPRTQIPCNVRICSSCSWPNSSMPPQLPVTWAPSRMNRGEIRELDEGYSSVHRDHSTHALVRCP